MGLFFEIFLRLHELLSVLFMPHAATFTSTSSSAGLGMGMSGR